MMKRILALCMTLLCLGNMVPFSAFAAENGTATAAVETVQPVETDQVEPQTDSGVAVADDTALASGTCGDSVTWSLSADYVLTISGTGAMENYTSGTGMPWAAYLNNITKVVVEQGVTTIGNYAFYGCKMTNVSLPEGITSLGTMSFVYCSNLRYVVIPSTVKTVNANALSGLSGARLILFQGNAPSIPTYAFSYFYGTICYPSGNSTWTSSMLSKGDNDGIWAAVEDQGTSGDVQWLRTNKNQVIVFGEGAMANYTSSNEAPWEESAESITTAELIKGVTTVGNRAFIGCKKLTDVILPTGVTSIGNYAFDDCLALTKITIPEGVTSIGSYAFYNCTNLVSVSLPSTLTAINNYAFYKCYKLPRIKLPEGLLTIGNYAFEYCSGINSITIPSTVTSLGIWALGHCGDLRVIFQGNKPTLGANIFYGCDAVNCWYLETATGFDTVGSGYQGADYLYWFSCKGGSCGDNVNYLYCNLNGQMLIYGEGPMTDYQTSSGAPWYSYNDEIYSVYVDYGVTSVGDYAFPFCYYLYHVGLAETVTKIGYYSFRSCKELATINFPDAITEIDHYAFQYCYALTSIDLPASLRTIGNTAFGSCTGLTKLEIPANVTNIYNDAFDNCTAVTEIVFRGDAPSFGSTVFAGITATAVYPTGNTTWTADKTVDHGGTLTWSDGYRGSVGENVTWHFDHVSGTLTISGTGEMYEYSGNTDVPWYSYLKQIKEVVIEEGVTNTCFCAFAYSTTLEKVTLPSTLTELGSSTFSGCTGLTEITLPENLQTIGAYAFESCTGLTDITIPDTVTEINGQVFWGCTGLTEIVIPASVTAIGVNAFGSSSLNQIKFLGDPPTLGSSVFYNLTVTAYYPVPNTAWESSSLLNSQYGGTVTWDSYPTETFSGTVADGLTWTLTPGGVLTISGEGAMPDYTSEASTPWYKAGFHTNYHSVVIESGVTYVGRYAFSKSNVETAYIAASAMGSDAFYECPLLTEVEIADGMTTMGSTNFYGCEALTNVTLPGSITAMGTYNFYNCPGITSLGPTGSGASIEYGWTEHVPDNAFYECLYVTEISFPSTLKSIGKDSFAYCKAVTRLELPEGLEIIGYRSFNTGHGLEEVIIPASVTYIDGWAFQDNHANIYFQGSAPEMHQYAFVNGRSTLHYHGADCSWIGVQNELSISLGTWVNMDDTTATHTPGEVVIENETAADCVTNESHDEVTYCTVCGKQASRTNVVTAEAWGHTVVVDAAVDATCTEDGLTEGNHCEVCGEVLVAQEVVAAAGHSYEDSTCTVCGDCLYTDRGTCGDSLSWCFWKDGTLTISGEGAMTTYSAVANTPWYSYLGSVLAITVEEGVTAISKNAFRDATVMTSLSLPTTLTDIGTSAFRGCSALIAVEIPAGTTVGTYAFYRCSALESAIVPSVENIGGNAFGYCPMLTTAGPIGGGYNIQFGISSTTLEANPFTWCSTITSIVLPEGIEAVGNNAFQDCISLKHISLPVGVTSIGVSAFSGCTGLESIQLPDTLTSISYYAFSNCSALAEVEIPTSVNEINMYAFQGCSSLQSIVIPDGVTILYTAVFEGCTSLQSVTLPESLVQIGTNAFCGCTGLTEITIPETVAVIDPQAFQGCTGLQSIVVPDSVSSLSARVFQDCTALVSVTLPDTILVIGDGAFSRCAALSNVALPAALTTIEQYAFEACTALTELEIPASVTAIGDNAFVGCTNLAEVYVASMDATIGSAAFAENTYLFCYLDSTTAAYAAENGNAYCAAEAGSDLGHGYEEVVTDPTCEEMGYTTHTCAWCGHNYVDTYTEAVGHSFTDYISNGDATCTADGTKTAQCDNGCGATDTVADEGTILAHGYEATVTPPTCVQEGYTTYTCVTCGDSYTDNYTPVIDHTVEHGTCTVCGTVFGMDSGTCGESLSWLLSEEGVLIITGTGAMTAFSSASEAPWYAYQSSITAVELCNGVTTVSAYAFRDATALTSVLLSSTVTDIGASAFRGCSALTSVNLPEGATVGSYAFYKCSALESVMIPDITRIGSNAFNQCPKLVSAGPVGGGYNVRFGTSDSVVRSGAFAWCGTITDIVLPEGIETLGYDAFRDWSTLKSVVLPDSLTAIGTNAFQGCSNLTELVLPDGIDEIMDNTFTDCTSLRTVNIPDGVTRIGYAAFWNCTALTGLVIPSSVEELGAGAFAQCSSIKEIVIPDSVMKIPDSCFQCCTALERVVIADTIDTIGNSAFLCCYKLQNVVIPDSVMVIEANAFSECFAMTEVLIPDTVESIGISAFYDCRGLTKVVIPETVTEIGDNCFQNCTGVSFYIYAMDTAFGTGAIEQTDNFVYCYEGSAAEAYTEGYARCVAPEGEDLGHIYDEVVTEPTCTENGCTAHTCGRCGDSYVTDVIEAVGHSWDAGVVTKEPTDEENGEILYTCTVCGETMADEIPNNHVDFVGMSLSLNGDIGINFYVTLSADMLADENARMVFNVGGKTQEMGLSNAPISPDEDGAVRYRFSCCMPAKGMADEIVAQMYKGDNAVGESKTYSVAAYYDDICAQFNREEKAELFALIESMLNYGATAQEYFGYNTDALANANVAAEIPETVDASAYADLVSNTEQDIFYAGTSLVLETNTTLRVFFRLVSGADVSNYSFTVDGKEVTPVQRGNLWYVELTDIAAKNLDDAHTFTAGEVTVICSALSYVNNVLNKADTMNEKLVTLCKALYAYNDAANVYFSK